MTEDQAAAIARLEKAMKAALPHERDEIAQALQAVQRKGAVPTPGWNDADEALEAQFDNMPV
jgi:hypothetical protein